MSKPRIPFWAVTGSKVEPPAAKKNAGFVENKPEGAQFFNDWADLIWKWIRGVQGSYADITVGSSAQVTANEATHDIDDFVAAISNGDHVHFLGPLTHTLGQNEDITETDVEITMDEDAILAFSTFTLTLSGVRSKANLRTSGAGAGDIIGSAQGVLFEITGADHTVFALSGGARGKILGAVTVEVLSGSGTWTKPDDVSVLKAFIVGGGGGAAGGKAANFQAGSDAGGGAGGAGGAGVAEQIISISGDVSYSIGSGGVGGAGGVGAEGADGADGTDTTFGPLLAQGGNKSIGIAGTDGDGVVGADNVLTAAVAAVAGTGVGASLGGNAGTTNAGESHASGAGGGGGGGGDLADTPGGIGGIGGIATGNSTAASGGGGGTGSASLGNGGDGGAAGPEICNGGGGGGGGGRSGSSVTPTDGGVGANGVAFGSGGGGGGGGGMDTGTNKDGGNGGNGGPGTVVLIY